MNFSNVSNITLSDSISGYVTADEGDDNDDSKYLSVLSPDISFNEMDVTVSNTTPGNNGETEMPEEGQDDVPQTFIFTVDGTNEIYGVQVAQDEDGNLQKYQIQYTENTSGELVPMLETIQILSLDDEVPTEESVDECNDINEIMENDQTLKADACVEHDKNDEFEGYHRSDNNEQLTTEHFHEELDFENEASSETHSEMISVKQELTDLIDDTVSQDSMHLNEEPNNECDAEESENYVTIEAVEVDSSNKYPMSFKVEDESFIEIEINENNIIDEYDTENEQQEMQEEVEGNENNGDIQFEQLFVEGNQSPDGRQIENAVPLITANDPEPEIYHFVNGLHVTGDVENNMPMSTILKESVEPQAKTNILKKPQRHSTKGEISSSDKVIYVQTLTEKENVGIIERSPRSNSRSLLKCNQLPQPLAVVPDPLRVEMVAEVCSQRYCRTKEAKQAGQFLNFINSTTIPQVPERKDRLPRKQQIKPLKHPNEDIEVKEMIVSSNGFIEPISKEEKKSLPVSEYVELLDSGEESYSVESKTKKKKKSKKQAELVEIEISDSEESEMDESPNSKKNSTSKESPITKKKRGRPPKNKDGAINKKDSDSNSESPPKISRMENEVEKVTMSMQVVQMGNENNTSNRQNERMSSGSNCLLEEIQQELGVERLNDDDDPTNVQVVERDSGSKIVQFSIDNEKQAGGLAEISSVSSETQTKQQPSQGFQYKHQCDKCNSRFINKILLTRHVCAAKPALAFSCDSCERRFPNVTSLNVHKRTHKDVVVTKKVPCQVPQFQKPVAKPNTRSSNTTNFLGVGVSNGRQSIMTKKPAPASSSLPNTSRLSYLPKPNLRPSGVASTMSRQSLMPKAVEAARSSTRNTSSLKVPTTRPNTFITPNKLAKPKCSTFGKDCDKCPMKFTNQAAWFNHQVLEHGLSTPDKSISETKPKKIVKPSTTHGGIPAKGLIAKNFSMIRKSMQQK